MQGYQALGKRAIGRWKECFKCANTRECMGEFQLDLNQILSLVGAANVLSAFLANSFGRMKNDSLLYAILNFLGTGLLALSVLSPLNLGILIVEVIWAGASLGLCFRAIRRKTKKNPESRGF